MRSANRGVGLAELDADPDLFAFDSRQDGVSSFSFSWHNTTFTAEVPREGGYPDATGLGRTPPADPHRHGHKRLLDICVCA
jgi:hypothetical protein